jgi:hypothetical protein
MTERRSIIVDARWIIVLAVPFIVWAVVTALALLIGWPLSELRSGEARTGVAAISLFVSAIAIPAITIALFLEGKPINFDLMHMRRA